MTQGPAWGAGLQPLGCCPAAAPRGTCARVHVVVVAAACQRVARPAQHLQDEGLLCAAAAAGGCRLCPLQHGRELQGVRPDGCVDHAQHRAIDQAVALEALLSAGKEAERGALFGFHPMRSRVSWPGSPPAGSPAAPRSAVPAPPHPRERCAAPPRPCRGTLAVPFHAITDLGASGHPHGVCKA